MIELTEARPSWLLRLDGPPLARVGAWRVTDPRIMVRQVTDGLEVSVGPAHSLRGEITVAGLEIQVVATGAARTRPESVPRPVKAYPVWTWRAVAPAVFVLVSVMLGLIESFTTRVSAARQRLA